MVEAAGIEPATSCMPCKRSPGLSYAPTNRADDRHFPGPAGAFLHSGPEKWQPYSNRPIVSSHCSEFNKGRASAVIRTGATISCLLGLC